jgi:hypothetical protein
VGIIKEKGPDYLIFKKDLKKAYRQIPICPGDLHLVGFNWNNNLFVDVLINFLKYQRHPEPFL